MGSLRNLIHCDYRSLFNLCSVDFKLLSIGWNYMANFKRTEVWVVFKISSSSSKLDIAQIECDIENIISILFDYMTQECATTDLIKVQLLSSNNMEINLPHRSYNYYKQNPLIKQIPNFTRKNLDSDKLEFKAVIVPDSSKIRGYE